MTRFGQTPTHYFGGKVQLAPLIVSLLPPHATYIEPFCGMGAVLFAKPPSRLEVLNDVDSLLVNFFRVLRDPAKCARLVELLDLTPYAREEWRSCGAVMETEDEDSISCELDDDVERARQWFTFVQQAFAGKVRGSASGGTGWRHTRMPGHNPADSYRSAIRRFHEFTKRLANVQIEHLDFADCIRAYDGPDVCFYVDPPYLPETRRGGVYRHELTRARHEELLDLLCHVAGMVLLSGYPSELYDRTLVEGAGWERLSVTVACSAVGRIQGSKYQGKGSVYGNGQTRTECVWLNPAAIRRQRTLFSVAGTEESLESEATAS